MVRIDSAPYARWMAILLRLSDSMPIPIAARATAGKAATCWLRLSERYASREHARLVFNGSVWMIQDIGSRNGTFVDGRRLDAGSSTSLVPGARIGFGQCEPSYEVASVEPPRALALDLESGEILRGELDLLALPSEERPDAAVVYPGGRSWMFETGGEAQAVDDLEIVRAGARVYRVHLPQLVETTPVVSVPFTLDNASFRFVVGRSDECVAIDVLFRGIAVARLESGEWGSVLLALARARLADRSRPHVERGWLSVDELCDQTALDPAALNVAIHRARKRVAATNLPGAPGIIEVRRGMRRLGTDRIELVDLNPRALP